jgi:hypothetical protein
MLNSCPYTVYRTVNLLNQKFYIGVHKTDDPLDKYLGSGALVLRAVQKYGADNFRKEILFTFKNATEAFDKEEELVAKESQNPQCYNMRKGGEGGFDYINRSGKSGQKLGAKRAGAKLQIWWKNHPELHAERRRKAIAQCKENRRLGKSVMKGDHLSEDHKQKLRESLSGERNPAFGNIWISHPIMRKKRHVPSEEVEAWVANGWQRGGLRRKKLNHSTSGRMWISKDGKSVYIFPNELETYVAQGWKRGRVTWMPSRAASR